MSEDILIQSPYIKLKNDNYSDSDELCSEDQRSNNDYISAKPKQSFNRQEYMKNYMREYMRNRSKQQKEKKINDKTVMKNGTELLIDIINAYSKFFTDEQLTSIRDICDTKKNEISYILQSLTNEIHNINLF